MISAAELRGEAGQSFQRPLFQVESGIGLFSSAAADSVGFFVRREDTPPCQYCACWGCTSSMWSGTFSFGSKGGVEYARELPGGANCRLSYPMINARTVNACQRCTFAWVFVLGEPHLERDEGG